MKWWYWLILGVVVLALGVVWVAKSGNGETPSQPAPAQTFGFPSKTAIMQSAFQELQSAEARRERQEAYEKELLRPGYEVIKYFDDLERAWGGFDSLSGELKGRAVELRKMITERMDKLNQRLSPQLPSVPPGAQPVPPGDG